MEKRALILLRGSARRNSPRIRFRDACSCVGAAAGPRSGCSAMTARDTGWHRSDSKGRFVWWPEATGTTKPLEAYEAQLLMAAGDLSKARAVPMWRRVDVLREIPRKSGL